MICKLNHSISDSSSEYYGFLFYIHLSNCYIRQFVQSQLPFCGTITKLFYSLRNHLTQALK